MRGAQTTARAAPAVKPARAGAGLVRRCACGEQAEQGGECAECRKRRLQSRSVAGAVRRAAGTGSAGSGTAQPALRRLESGALGKGDPLPAPVRDDFEARLGHDFRRVRVHSGERAAELAEALSARAFTVGTDVAFARGEYAPGTPAGRRLLAHELTHVVQQGGSAAPGGPLTLGPVDDPLEREAHAVAARVDAPGPSPAAGGRTPRAVLSPAPVGVRAAPRVQRDDVGEATQATPSVSGDSSRDGPPEGVALTDGTLFWEFRYVGVAGQVSSSGPMTVSRGTDVRMTARFRPSTGSRCPTVTFLQTVRPTVGGIPDPGHPKLLETRDPGSGHSADVLAEENEPFYGAGVTPGAPGLGGEKGAVVAGTGSGVARGREATFTDGPIHDTSSIPRGQTLVREFELAAICVETGVTLGSIRWGYTKTRGAVITLTGGQRGDVRTGSASPQVEATRQAFYRGHFQHSLGGFARGSATLTRAHRATLDGVASQGMLSRVVLVGANDFSGGAEADAGLSLRRAEAARDYLVAQGVSSSIITVEGHGVEAREPNPAGQQVAANRRVDVRVERGLTGGTGGAQGSARESLRLRRQNPRRTLQELGDWITRWTVRGGRIPVADCNQLTHLLDGIRRWRGLDPSVPDPEATWGDTIRTLRGRCESLVPRERPPFETGPEPQRRSFRERITESVEEAPL